MRYLLLIHEDESRYSKMSEEDNAKLMAEYQRFGEEIGKAGAYVASNRLRPTTMATTVRVRRDETLITDGPFAETKEQLGGFYLIEAKDLDDAIRWASRIPSARNGCVEVRPIWEMTIDSNTKGSGK